LKKAQFVTALGIATFLRILHEFTLFLQKSAKACPGGSSFAHRDEGLARIKSNTSESIIACAASLGFVILEEYGT